MTSPNRYYFHLWAQDRFYDDSDGVELPDLHAAWDELIRVDHELRSEPTGMSNVWIEVADGTNRTVLVVPVGGSQPIYSQSLVVVGSSQQSH
jgi:hypothetical protein